MLEEYLGELVVLDLRSPYVCIGTLTRIGSHFVELTDADVHDLRDTHVTREEYVITVRDTGVQRNRLRAFVARDEIVAASRLSDVVEK